MRRLHHFVGLIAAAACVLATGCAADRVAGMKSLPSSAMQAVVVDAGDCRFSVRSIDDLRENTSLGVVGRTRVDGEEFTEWFAKGIAAIPGYTRDGAPTELRIEILKTYIHSLGTLKSANLVVRVKGVGGGASLLTKTYRGVDGSVNWSSSESEIQAAFDSALADLQLQMGSDLRGACKR